MKLSNLFFLAGAIYIAPHLSKRMALALTYACLAAQLYFAWRGN